MVKLTSHSLEWHPDRISRGMRRRLRLCLDGRMASRGQPIMDWIFGLTTRDLPKLLFTRALVMAETPFKDRGNGENLRDRVQLYGAANPVRWIIWRGSIIRTTKSSCQ